MTNSQYMYCSFILGGFTGVGIGVTIAILFMGAKFFGVCY